MTISREISDFSNFDPLQSKEEKISPKMQSSLAKRSTPKCPFRPGHSEMAGGRRG